MKQRVLLLLFIFHSVFSLQAGSWNGRLFFHHLGRINGLSNLSVSSIVQDYRGFLWFGTLNGLNRYDGKTIELLSHDPYSRDSIPHNKIQTMKVWKKKILVGTYGGLGILDVDTKTFTNFEKKPGVLDSLSDNVVVSIMPDTDGKIWVGTLYGLNLLDPATGKCIHFFHDEDNPDSIANDVIRALYLDSENRLWIGTYNGLDRFDRESGRFIHYGISGSGGITLPSKYVMAIQGGGEGVLWIGMWDGGVARFDTVEGKLSCFSLDDDRVYSLSTAQEGKVWAGTWGGGLYIIDKATGETEKYVYQPGNLTSLSHDIVYSILRDDSGLFWIGTNGGGVNNTAVEKRHDLFLYHDENDPGSLSKGNIYAILEDDEKNIWIGTSGGGLDRWNRETETLKHYRHGDGSGLPYDTVTCLLKDSAGKLLVGTLKGLVYRTEEDEKFHPYLVDMEHIYALFEDSRNNLWIGTYDNGLYVYDRGKDTLEHFTSSLENKGSLSSNLVTSFAEYDGDIWIGTNEGLNRFNFSTRSFSAYFLNPDDITSISSNSIRTLFVDSRNRLWIGTEGGGLDRYNEADDDFSHYLKKDGFSDDSVTGILEDDSGRLWCGTKAGITIFNPVSEYMMVLTEFDGLPDISLNYGVMKDPDGFLYFSSSKGIIRFSQKVSRMNIHKPPVYITDVRSMGQRVVNPFTREDGEVFDLPSHLNLVSFHFIGLDYTAPLKNRYMYRLEGFDADWIDSGGSTEVSYINLSPGKYTFHVKASNNDGFWSDKDDSITIRVVPPVWKSLPAQILYDILLVFLIFMGIKVREHFYLKKKVAELGAMHEKLISANQEIKVNSITDSLTGLFNRVEFDYRIAVETARSRRFSSSFAVLLIDIDYFEDYNERYGSSEGDNCLVLTAETLKGCLVRSSDFIARCGGDEFCVILPECGKDDALKTGERIKRAVQKKRIPHHKSGIGGIVTVSIGIAAAVPMQSTEPDEYLKTAEKALAKAKKSGRNRVVFLPME